MTEDIDLELIRQSIKEKKILLRKLLENMENKK
jgi:hypothetical protein